MSRYTNTHGALIQRVYATMCELSVRGGRREETRTKTSKNASGDEKRSIQSMADSLKEYGRDDKTNERGARKMSTSACYLGIECGGLFGQHRAVRRHLSCVGRYVFSGMW